MKRATKKSLKGGLKTAVKKLTGDYAAGKMTTEEFIAKGKKADAAYKSAIKGRPINKGR